MPIYEYLCGNCGRSFEQLQRMTDDPLTTDPDCGGPVRRVIQPVGIIFKGSGFYATDSRKSSSSSSPAENGKSHSESSGKTDKGDKTESKSESKAESSSSNGSKAPSSENASKPSTSTPAAAAS